MRMGVNESPCERSAGTFWTWLCPRLPWSCTLAVGKNANQVQMSINLVVMCTSTCVLTCVIYHHLWFAVSFNFDYICRFLIHTGAGKLWWGGCLPNGLLLALSILFSCLEALESINWDFTNCIAGQHATWQEGMVQLIYWRVRENVMFSKLPLSSLFSSTHTNHVQR